MRTLLIILFSAVFFNGYAKKDKTFRPRMVYQSENLTITQISKHAFAHASFLQTQDFGKVSCNGLIVTDHNEAVIFDTPTDDMGSEELIGWIKDTLHCRIKAIIPTHFHNDCLGGLKAFERHHISSYAYYKTIELARENKVTVPQNSFNDSLVLLVGGERIVARFFGEGHTKDNVIGYFPSENIMFGGCLIKEVGASEGYLGDANVAAWSHTVEQVKRKYPYVQIVIPGHGAHGGPELLDYTIQLFKRK